MNNLLSIIEASKKLRVSTMTLRRWDNDGKLRAVIINDRGDRRYRLEDIEEFVKQRLSK